jgi:hypothetical protein
MTRLIVGIACAGAAVILLLLPLWMAAGAGGVGILSVLLALCFLLAAVVLLQTSRRRI